MIKLPAELQRGVCFLPIGQGFYTIPNNHKGQIVSGISDIRRYVKPAIVAKIIPQTKAVMF
jgi:hypothetical protein